MCVARRHVQVKCSAVAPWVFPGGPRPRLAEKVMVFNACFRKARVVPAARPSLQRKPIQYPA